MTARIRTYPRYLSWENLTLSHISPQKWTLTWIWTCRLHLIVNSIKNVVSRIAQFMNKNFSERKIYRYRPKSLTMSTMPSELFFIDTEQKMQTMIFKKLLISGDIDSMGWGCSVCNHFAPRLVRQWCRVLVWLWSSLLPLRYGVEWKLSKQGPSTMNPFLEWTRSTKHRYLS